MKSSIGATELAGFVSTCSAVGDSSSDSSDSDDDSASDSDSELSASVEGLLGS